MIPVCILAIECESDREFMTGLYENYHRLMYSQIIKIVRDDFVAEDLLHDVLVKLIDKIDELREKPRDKLVNYIISSCKNRSLNYLRDRKIGADVPWEFWDNLPDPEQDRNQMELMIVTKEDLSRLSQVWPQLDSRNQNILERYYIEEKSVREISEELGIKAESVRMALTRARRAAYALMKKT